MSPKALTLILRCFFASGGITVQIAAASVHEATGQDPGKEQDGAMSPLAGFESVPWKFTTVQYPCAGQHFQQTLLNDCGHGRDASTGHTWEIQQTQQLPRYPTLGVSRGAPAPEHPAEYPSSAFWYSTNEYILGRSEAQSDSLLSSILLRSAIWWKVQVFPKMIRKGVPYLHLKQNSPNPTKGASVKHSQTWEKKHTRILWEEAIVISWCQACFTAYSSFLIGCRGLPSFFRGRCPHTTLLACHWQSSNEKYLPTSKARQKTLPWRQK